MTTTAQPSQPAARSLRPVLAGAPRPMRGDAARNRARVLDAARAAFAEDGAEVQMEQIARRAGVGVGTLYRNFPTKQALINELAQRWMDERVEIADQALSMPDPAEAFGWFVRRTAEDMAGDAGLCHMFGEHSAGNCEMPDLLVERTEMLLARAREAGAVRADVSVSDFQAILGGLSAAIAQTEKWELFAEMLVTGLRAPCP
ncbi:TetR family transcriptional regulator [Asanoa ishikariensis]|uniref:Transcriptional regulator, TetR family n=1 Tax=Asanoa ishikariensis TaxID=137265 RepID=A0A1H3KZJ6_9ACTN|nr:TetR/AcrR family transcriptional regulator [Asanoa ishikariensis]GIF69593.1 TetR family transcriptional regulator [Asanoa ishikariensis]SDY57510.1 transcriptional regulator, TetR family [Asanoa ishikariensis]